MLGHSVYLSPQQHQYPRGIPIQFPRAGYSEGRAPKRHAASNCAKWQRNLEARAKGAAKMEVERHDSPQ